MLVTSLERLSGRFKILRGIMWEVGLQPATIPC